MALPLNPGVYIMKNKDKKIIYIGKAKALKNRVSSYFGSHSNHSLKVIRMVENVDDFDYILCDTEFEALILECSLIKQHMPKYNILLKDDKGYNYIKVTKEEFPRITACYRMDEDNAEYIGPFISNFSVKSAVEETLKIFKLPRCNKRFPRDYGKSRPCLNGFMGLCASPCSGGITKEDYVQSVSDAVDFLKGGSAKAVKSLTAKMEQYSENLEFEKAAKIRDQIKAIRNLDEKQKVVSINVPEEDVFALVNSNKKACFDVIRFKNGRLTDSEHWLIDSVDDLPQARFELIERYYAMRDYIPSRIAVDGEIADEALLQEYLEYTRGKKVEIIHPQKGEHLKIVNMCIKNANEQLAQQQGRLGKEMAALEELAQLLALPKPPEYIESSDSYFVPMQPLFALRLKSAADLSSVDLWSFRLKSVTLQRGGVTILNNVINASNGEQTTLKLDMGAEGSVSVMVMTLDGNIVKYLHHGTASKGEHYFNWDGTTKSGRTVARGLYFIRVIGSGFDETRKVLVVKD